MILLGPTRCNRPGTKLVEKALDPPVSERLGEIDRPTLVIVGDEDIADMQAIAAHVAASITGAQLVRAPRAAHLPSLERPEEVNTGSCSDSSAGPRAEGDRICEAEGPAAAPLAGPKRVKSLSCTSDAGQKGVGVL